MEHVSINSLERGREARRKLGTFIVERRRAIPAEAMPMLRDALTEASRRLSARGQPVRYLRSTSFPAEDRLLCFFEAVSADAVRTVNRTAQAPFTSIREVTKDTYLPTS
jgi:Protein of unknown function (DUF4242)